MNITMTRRSVLAGIAATVPLLALGNKAKALTNAAAEDVHFPLPSGLWTTLEHVTDGSDPSTALAAPPAPKFTPAIRALAGTDVELTGYLTPLASGFGAKKEYLLSREAFHCAYCYTFGRGSLALVAFDGHVPPTSGKVTVKAVLALQDENADDFYFQLKKAKIA